jgi:type IX secretion system PorP/SprF family membrane protein
MIKKLLLFTLLTLCTLESWSQDPQFSQFYANPLYLNPAMAGSALAPRATVNYRNQWPALSANFVTSSFGADLFLSKINSGVGMLVTMDSQGLGNLKSTEVGLQYAYQLRLNEETYVRMGLQGSYATRTLDYFGLTFGDQFSNQGYMGNPTQEPLVQNGMPQVSYADFSSGVLMYSDWYWAGLAVHHINRPNQAFSSIDLARLPMKTSFHAGLRIPFAGYTYLGNEIDREKTISPAIMYKSQGKFDQFDAGLYVTYAPMVFGAWYRGIPVKKYAENINNHESLIALVGFRQDKFSIGYSYDATISTLGLGSGGAHEISLSYLFENLDPRGQRTRRKEKMLSCPKF